MRDLLTQLVDAATARAAYADARYVRRVSEELTVRNGEPSRDRREDEGVGIRVRVDGAWGFAATRRTDRPALEEALERALAVAQAQPVSRARPLAPEQPARGSWSSPMELDPLDMALDDKLAPLAEADAAMRAEPRVTVARADFMAWRTEITFASSEGALFEQRITECGGGISAIAAEDGESYVRSWPSSHGGSVAQAGAEHFLGLELAAEAPRVAEESVALLSAPACPHGRTTLVLAGEQLGLQIHESVGHALELDRVLGFEASYAGTSFVPADGIGSFRFGSPLMDVTADATMPGGLGTFRWDDEGVEGQALPLVREGVLAGYLSSRESAAEIGARRSGGCMRAEGFARQPVVRMTNVSLEPGRAGTLDDLLADTDDGVLIETNRSWSIDSQRLQFQFEGEAAWEIKHGRRGQLLKAPSYAGVTPEFWGSLDAVCSAPERSVYSVLQCGKAEPGQVARVSHGSSPARFRDVEVGVA